MRQTRRNVPLLEIVKPTVSITVQFSNPACLIGWYMVTQHFLCINPLKLYAKFVVLTSLFSFQHSTVCSNLKHQN